jgi:hypothetical protein
MSDSTRARRWPAAVTIAAAALALAAVLGPPHSGAAASSAVPSSTTAPGISGTFQETATVSATTGTWSGDPTSYGYVWERCDAAGANCSAIAGATAQSIQLHTADVGHTIRVVVTASNSSGSARATSDPSPVVASQTAPGDSALPVISGTTRETQTLNATTGSWTNSPTSYSYTWKRCDGTGAGCVAIPGATAQSLQLQTADVGHRIRVTVAAKNASGSSAATSEATPVVVSQSAPPVPAATAAPTISGGTTVGSTLTGSPGTWSGSPTTWGYSWSRCDKSGDNCGAIGGATGTTYVLTPADAGSTIRYTVTAGNSTGSAQSTSAPTAVVAAATTTTTTTSTATTAGTGCPSGTGTIQVSDLAPPARLGIDSQTITPGVVTPGTGQIQLRLRVTACGGRPVEGATAFATPVPYNQYTVGQATTGADGFAVMTLSQLSGFPAARRQQLLAVFTRATKPGEPLLGGVSTRRLVTFPVRLR